MGTVSRFSYIDSHQHYNTLGMFVQRDRHKDEMGIKTLVGQALLRY